MKIKATTQVIGGDMYLTVTDPMSGKRNMYTVYRISLVGSKRVKLIGRELPKRYANKFIAKQKVRSLLW